MEKLKELLANNKFSEKIIGFYKELKSKDDERWIIELSKSKQVDFIIVYSKDWKNITF